MDQEGGAPEGGVVMLPTTPTGLGNGSGCCRPRSLLEWRVAL